MSQTAEPSDPNVSTDQTITVGETADGEDIELPIEEVLTGRMFGTGKSGVGKSNTGSVIAEELLERGHPLLIVDVDGEYWGLKETYEVLHVGATEECDLQVGPEHAGKLADLALEQHVPIVLDVSGYVDGDEADELVHEVARELFAREQQAMQPFLMLVEEIHEYIPEGGGLDETGEMLIRVAKRGRKRGLGIAGLSQRPADVKKDFITQADLLIWHRLTWENDTDVVKRVVGSEYADQVSGLADGEAFVQADWSETDVKRVQFRRKRTFDAGATPGLEDAKRPELKSIDEDLVDELTEISDRHERRQDRIAELEARLEEKDERIAELEDELEDARDLQRLGEAFVDAAQSSGDAGLEAEQQELLEEKNETIADLRERVDELEAHISEVRNERNDLEAEVKRLRGVEQRIEQAERIEEQLERAREVLSVEMRDSPAADAEAASEDVQALRADLSNAQERIADLEGENDRLRERLDDAGGITVPSDYQDFVDEPVVQDAIEEAKAKSNASPRYVKGTIAAIIQEGGPVDYDTVADRLGVKGTSGVSKAASTLEALGVLERVQQSPALVDFDLEAAADIKAAQKRREQAEEVMQEL